MGSRTGWTAGIVIAVLAALAAWVAFSMFYDELGLTPRNRTWIEEHVVLPPFRPRCCGGNELSAMATLRNLSSAQATFAASASVDEDRDGSGEFGTFLELSGALAVRGATRHLDPPLLSGAFRTVDASGEATRPGYLFRIWLAGRDGRAVGETPAGLAAGVVDPDAAELHWRCYAWPASYDHSGLRTFCVDDTGDIFATECARFSGPGAGPAPDASDGRPSATTTTYTGVRGDVWTMVN